MVNRTLDITWDDPDTTQRVEDIIESAIPTMIDKLGIADPNFDFSNAGMERTLFLSYCLYEWNHCVNEFDKNYLENILQCREKHLVEYYAKLEVEDDD